MSDNHGKVLHECKSRSLFPLDYILILIQLILVLQDDATRKFSLNKMYSSYLSCRWLESCNLLTLKVNASRPDLWSELKANMIIGQNE